VSSTTFPDFSKTFAAGAALADRLHLPATLCHDPSRREEEGWIDMGKVMVVDDAYSELQIMESILKSAGHDVIAYLDGEQLEEKIATERPDVVLLDIVMPKRNGFDVLRCLRRDARVKETRVVVVSSKNQDSDRAWGLRQGADEYLAKPFTAEKLLTAIRRFVR
jgi:DNA-binding response OmpR family regulator